MYYILWKFQLSPYNAIEIQITDRQMDRRLSGGMDSGILVIGPRWHPSSVKP